MSIDQSPPTDVESEAATPAAVPVPRGTEGAAPAAAGPDGAEPMPASHWARLGIVAGLLVLLTATTGVWGLVMVMGIVLMIFLHELGHFVMAKRAGMKVTEFFLGFGPVIWSIRRGETTYGLKAVPAGAYVRIIGMSNLEEVDPADEARTYRQQPFWPRFGVAVAGSTVHFMIATVLLFIVLVGFGLPGGSLDPDQTDWRVGTVSEGSAAAQAGLQRGDDVVSVDGEPTPTFDDLRAAVVDRPGDTVTMVVVRDGAPRDVEVTIGARDDAPDQGFLGVGYSLPVERYGVVEAVPATARELGVVTAQSAGGLVRVFTPSGITSFGRQVANANDDAPAETESEAGASASASTEPSEEDQTRLLSLLGVFRIGVGAADAGGVASLLILFIFINVFVGIFNMLPMLPFDGGHVVIAVYEKIQEKRKHLDHRYFADVGRLMPMTYAVVFVLGLIFVSSLYLDIANPVQVN